MQSRGLDLNVATPEEVADILERASDDYRWTAYDLALAWGDTGRNPTWIKLADILADAAEKCREAVK